MKNEREMFEKFILSRNPDACVARANDGDYLLPTMQCRWEGWLARSKLNVKVLKSGIARTK